MNSSPDVSNPPLYRILATRRIWLLVFAVVKLGMLAVALT
jgi:hypothetical protein